jgi:hypothetical protein
MAVYHYLIAVMATRWQEHLAAAANQMIHMASGVTLWGFDLLGTER